MFSELAKQWKHFYLYCVKVCVCRRTGAAVVSLHPDVAVVLGHAGLRVQEWQADTALGTQAGIIAAALLDGVLVELIAQPAREKQQR